MTTQTLTDLPPKLVILDTETTGLNGTPVEVAWLDVDEDPGLTILAEHRYLVNPERPIEQGAFEVHGISDEMVADKPNLIETMKVLPNPVYVIAHNAPFDVRMMGDTLNVVGTLCSLELARLYITNTTNHKLPTLQKELGLPVRDSHTALGDVHTVRDLLLQVILPKAGVTIETLFARQSKPRMISRMPYGKHKGLLMAQVPRAYRAWLLQQEIDPSLRYTLERLKHV